ncbi:MAG: DUF3656 domain-containing U32 family peptidase [Christensenellales bacterium]|jgi:putative protease
MNKCELLSPAGSEDALKAAICAGADAVYLGGRILNARMPAQNFDDKAMEDAARLCHLNNTRLYVTLNVLVKPAELEAAVKYAGFLNDIGVDAIIVQDIGLLRELKRLYPDLRLHASTQAGINTLDGVLMAEKIGFSRVVLSREVPIEDIAAISAGCSAGLEVFCHGALCASFSGQCYMSSLIGGRSGNRGRCAQPCRRRYAPDGEAITSPYILSAADLCTLPVLGRLLDAGVSSLKIEGRLKRPEYVALVTSVYRRALDAALEGREYDYTEDNDDLIKMFNRGGFTRGYAFGDEIFAPERQNNWGEKVGRVISVSGGWAVVELDKPLFKGDGIEFSGKEQHGGMEITEPVSGRSSLPVRKGVMPGDEVRRTTNAAVMAKARTIYDELPLINVHAKFEAADIAKLDICDEFGCVSVFEKTEPAKSRPLDTETAKKQLLKTGGTQFNISSIDISIKEAVFLPVSALNDMRRRAFEAFADGRARRLMDTAEPVFQYSLIESGLAAPSSRTLLTAQSGSERLLHAAAKYADELHFEPSGDEYADLSTIERLAGGPPLYIVLPPVAMQEETERLKRLIDACSVNIKGVVASSIGQCLLKDEYGDLDFIGGLSLNVFNEAAERAFRAMGLSRVCVSTEMTADEMRDIITRNEAVVYGRLPAMTLMRPPAGFDERHSAIKDERGYSFPVRKSGCGRTYTVFNSVKLSLAQRAASLKAAAVKVLISDDEDITALAGYRSLIDGGDYKAADNDTNTGHFFRGVD